MTDRTAFRDSLRELINSHSKENGSNTPDFILAHYLDDCLTAFDSAMRSREAWYGSKPKGGVCPVCGDPAEGHACKVHQGR